jgi:hypothetical protein
MTAAVITEPTNWEGSCQTGVIDCSKERPTAITVSVAIGMITNSLRDLRHS